MVSGNVRKFADLADVIINGENSVRLNQLWKNSFLNNATRTFLFKLHNNLLGMNNRVANFVRGHPRTCTFCDMLRDPAENVENTRHLFYECTSVEAALCNFFTWLLNSNVQINVSASEFFVGFNFENSNKNAVLDVVLVILKKTIWDCKLRYVVPTGAILKESFLDEYRKLFRNSSQVREHTRKSDIFLHHPEVRF